MASIPVPNFAPTPLRLCNFQWLWNPIVDTKSVLDDQYQKYIDVENDMIENAFKTNQPDVELDGGRVINLQCMLQYNKTNESECYPIKRILLDGHHRTRQLRKERFAAEIPLYNTTSDHAVEAKSLLYYMRSCSIIPKIYKISDRSNWTKSVSDILKEAAEGMIKEGTVLGKEKEARYLADRLEHIQVFAKNLVPYELIPSEIGDVLVNIYTKDSFWFKLINQVARNIRVITPDKVATIGPFCYLLYQYLLSKDEISNFSVVYRGIQLTDEERLNFMQPDVIFSSFTSTSKNQNLAEWFGNTLLIIELSQSKNSCGNDISEISNFPEEEEFLICPGSYFNFVKYEYDECKGKHICYLKAPRRKPQ